MGIFLSKSQGSARPSIKIVLLGPENAGKTSLLARLSNVQPGGDSPAPTIGFNLAELSISRRKALVFDVGGGASALWPNYVKDADLVVFLIDAADEKQFAKIKAEMKKLSTIISKNATVIFALNKIDTGKAILSQEFIEQFEIEKIFANDLFLHRVSALKGTGVPQLVEKISAVVNAPRLIVDKENRPKLPAKTPAKPAKIRRF